MRRARSGPSPRRAGPPLAAVAAAASCALACSTVSPRVAAPAGAAASELAARADAATVALIDRFWDGEAADFSARWTPAGGPSRERAGYWISAIAVHALLDGAARTGGGRALEVARAFLAAQDGRGWARDWFDDEAWMALALLRAHDLTGDAGLLARAAALVDDVARGAPDATCCGTTPGGLWWDRAHTQKATAANAVPAIAAARLFERTGEARWLDLARATYAAWRRAAVDPATGQVADHVLPGGERIWWRFSYDGGAMVGAALALHRATGQPGYLDDARRYAAFLLSAQTRPTRFGPVLFDGAACDGDCEAFKGVTHRHLDALASSAPGVPGLAALLEADGEAIWSLARDGRSGIFGVDWGAPPGPGASLASQAAAATALNLAAARAARAPTAREGRSAVPPAVAAPGRGAAVGDGAAAVARDGARRRGEAPAREAAVAGRRGPGPTPHEPAPPRRRAAEGRGVRRRRGDRPETVAAVAEAPPEPEAGAVRRGPPPAPRVPPAVPPPAEVMAT